MLNSCKKNKSHVDHIPNFDDANTTSLRLDFDRFTKGIHDDHHVSM